MHKDVNNHREHLNYTIAIGDFTGGELWIHDDTVRKDEPGCINKIAPTGAKLGGRLHRSKSKIISFDPKTFHCVTPWKGERWSITGYVNRAVHRLDSHQLEKLKSLGFLLPKQKNFPPAVPAEIDEEMTLYELATMDPPAPAPVSRASSLLLRKERGMLQMGILVRVVVGKDFHECIKPIRAYQFKVPEGDFTFPMKQRTLSPQLNRPLKLLTPTGRPSAVANPVKDEWTIRGDKLIRFHYSPRRELFSPDLTDCPVPISALGKERLTKIMPIGGTDIIADCDEWRHVRKRNKKLSFKWVGRTEFDILTKPHTSEEAVKDFPCMPTVPMSSHQHRDKIPASHALTAEQVQEAMAMVARPVGRKELLADPQAQASLDVEWEKLMKKKAWDMSSVREWEEVSKEAAKRGKKAHVGKIFEICVEKGSELPKGNPLRKFKGRTVFQGNNVKDENNDTALFSELGSSPATMEAGKVLDAYGHAPGHDVEQGDGKQAYTQTTLKGADTWVRLPRERWPKEWVGKFRDPVVRLRLALYGHPDSGGFWEQHCEKRLREVGFELVFPAAWPSVFYHPTLKLLLAVYVDDFKMAGPKENLAKGWELIGSRIDMATPASVPPPAVASDSRNSPDVESLIYSMKWGYHLDQLIDEALKHLNEARDHHPEGAATHIIFGWSGNDVWGQHGYHGYTWHLQSKFTKRTAEELEQIDTWPAKQKLRVDRACERACKLLHRTDVSGVSFLMGCTIIDPVELYEQTSRPDGFHADASDQNLQSTLRWHAAMLRGILTDYRLLAVEQQLIANQREAVFHAHFVLNKPEPFLTVPPASGRILSKIVDSPDPPLAREAEEEIVLAGPLLAEAEYEVVNDDSAQSCNPQPITEFDFARNDTRPGAGCVLAIEDGDPINVVAEEHLVMANQAAEGITQEELTAVAAEEEITLLSQFVEQDDDPYENADTYSLKKAEVVAPPSPVVVIDDPDAPQPSEAVAQAPLVPKAKPRPPTLPRWVTADQLPDLPDDYRFLTENARVCLSKKMSFLARGFANRRAPEMAVHISARDNSIEWSEFFEKLGMMWRGLRVEHVVDVLKSTHDKVRFEVKVVIKPDREVQLRAFRAIQGHDGILLSEETDVMALNTHSPYQIAHEENLTVEDEIIRLEDLKFADNAPRPEPLAEAKWGSTLKVWFSAKGIRVDRKYRSELDHFIVQELVSFPWFYCTSCRKHYIDGMIECQFCGSRIAAESDMAHVAEPSKRRLESSRKGRNIDIMSIERAKHKIKVSLQQCAANA
ncbi:unnamed protein product [Symbiodinium natans]|uniref:Fe2OG dioxygenase domain-containing protein n=1 Tax=Symbiodinium natans TaxID=878477 RepID=A0A812PGT5_9DINO|nr:unnamed protein product [Symbiodinium natans]